MILKILMFVPKFPFPIIGGMEKQSCLLSNELMNQGLEISVLSTIFTKEHKSFELIKFFGHLAKPNLSESRLNCSFFFNTRSNR